MYRIKKTDVNSPSLRSYMKACNTYLLSFVVLAAYMFFAIRRHYRLSDCCFAAALMISVAAMILMYQGREHISMLLRQQLIIVNTIIFVPLLCLYIYPKNNFYADSKAWGAAELAYFLASILFWIFVKRGEKKKPDIRAFFAENYYLCGLCLAVVILCLSVFDNYIVEDSRSYSLDLINQMRNATFEPGPMKTFKVCYHTSYGFSIWYIPLASLLSSHAYGARLTNILMWDACIVLFWLICKKLFANIKPALLVFSTTIFAFTPMIFGPLHDVDLELAVLFNFMLLLYAFLTQRHILEVFFAMLLAFSKENAIAPLVGFFGGMLLYRIFNNKAFKEKSTAFIRNYGRSVFSVFLAIVMYGSFFIASEGVAWNRATDIPFLRNVFDYIESLDDEPEPEYVCPGSPEASNTVSDVVAGSAVAEEVALASEPVTAELSDKTYPLRADSQEAVNMPEENKNFNRLGLNMIMITAKLKQIFVLNFAWIATLIILAGTIILFATKRLKIKAIGWEYMLPVAGAFAAFMAAQVLLITYCSPRYIKMAPFFVVLAATAVLYKLDLDEKMITTAGILGTVLIMAQNYYSLDPVSNLAFERIDMGKTKMILETPTYDLAACDVLATAKENGNRYLYASAQTSRQFTTFEEFFEICYKAMDYKDGDFLMLADNNPNYALSFFYGNSTNYMKYNTATAQFEDTFEDKKYDSDIYATINTQFLSEEGMDKGFEGKGAWTYCKGNVYYIAFAFTEDLNDRILSTYANEFVADVSHKGWTAKIYRLEK